ncbi:MAG TPA: hypothetical protein VNC62_19125 [Burkholderiales bacterium]|jgi:hypothetical protein|nr:hypothetical protein [Burkholderiales bacterium]
MPLVRISLVKGKPEAYRRKAGDAIHRALERLVIIRSPSARDACSSGSARVAKENWSFGNGVASYAPAEAAAVE